jgi:hypothetical protein
MDVTAGARGCARSRPATGPGAPDADDEPTFLANAALPITTPETRTQDSAPADAGPAAVADSLACVSRVRHWWA